MTQTVPNQLSSSVLAAFASRLSGKLVRPGDADYDAARRVFNGMIDRRPAVILQCLSAGDVQEAVRFARQHGVRAAVRGGGHSVQGFGVCDGGVVIDLSLMNAVSVDPTARVARAEGGATWTLLDAATQAHGLAVTGGRVGSTGVVGLALGSGSGWLERALGYTVDSMIGADVVLADGSLVHASGTENSDLFWGLRGGGGNFGIVTSIELMLHRVGPTVFGGMMVFPRERSAGVLRAYRTFMATAPNQVGGAAALLCAPPAPFIPVEAQLEPVMAIVACYWGNPDDGAAVFQPLADLGPMVDMTGPMPYLELQKLLDAGNPPGMQNYWKAEMLEELDDATIEAFVTTAARPPSRMTVLIVQPLGGAIRNVTDDAMAMGWRTASWAFHLLGMWPDPSENASQIAWIRSVHASIAPKAMAAGYLNYLMDEGEEKVKASFGAGYGRMVELKRKYDPTNFFNMNQNIPPR